jgi:hypothetical protein
LITTADPISKLAHPRGRAFIDLSDLISNPAPTGFAAQPQSS